MNKIKLMIGAIVMIASIFFSQKNVLADELETESSDSSFVEYANPYPWVEDYGELPSDIGIDISEYEYIYFNYYDSYGSIPVAILAWKGELYPRFNVNGSGYNFLNLTNYTDETIDLYLIGYNKDSSKWYCNLVSTLETDEFYTISGNTSNTHIDVSIIYSTVDIYSDYDYTLFFRGVVTTPTIAKMSPREIVQMTMSQITCLLISGILLVVGSIALRKGWGALVNIFYRA